MPIPYSGFSLRPSLSCPDFYSEDVQTFGSNRGEEGSHQRVTSVTTRVQLFVSIGERDVKTERRKRPYH